MFNTILNLKPKTTFSVCFLAISFAAVPLLSVEKLKLDAWYEPTPQKVVRGMLDLANVKNSDVVYDLGCGDGRIVIEAARRYGAAGVGVDLDPDRIMESKRNAEAAGVKEKVTFIQDDLYSVSVKDADVVALFLTPQANLKLRAKLLTQLKPGSRIVSNSHDMGEWPPHKKRVVAGREIFLWVIPEP